MRRWLGVVCIVFMALACSMGAQASTHVQLVGTYPVGDTVTLGRGQTFYLHLHYRTDQQVHLWVNAYALGKKVGVGSSPSRQYAAGEGDALVWFFPIKPGVDIDEVRILAGDGSTAGTHEVASFAVDVIAGTGAVTATAQPAWLVDLLHQDKLARAAARKHAQSHSMSAGDAAFAGGLVLLMFGVGLAGMFWPAWALWRWRGGWRLAAAVPAALMGFVVLRIFFGVAIDPTSHNLWPFEILQAGVLSLAVMIGLGVARKLGRVGKGA